MDKFFVKEFFDKSTDIIILIIYLIKLKKEKIIRRRGVDNFGAAECGVWNAVCGAAQSSSRFLSDKVNIKKPLQHICKNHFDEKYTIYPDIYYFCIVNNKHVGCDAGCDETN